MVGGAFGSDEGVEGRLWFRHLEHCFLKQGSSRVDWVVNALFEITQNRSDNFLKIS